MMAPQIQEVSILYLDSDVLYLMYYIPRLILTFWLLKSLLSTENEMTQVTAMDG